MMKAPKGFDTRISLFCVCAQICVLYFCSSVTLFSFQQKYFPNTSQI